LDLNEHALTEPQRTLKRLGITHVLLPPQDPQEHEDVHPALTSETLHPVTTGSPPPGVPGSSTVGEPLPALLRSLFHGKHAPLRTMWTYRGLYEDMLRKDTPPRLEVFKKIQASVCSHLKWSTEEISSWPMDVDTETFRKGLEFFRPRIILLFLEDHHESGILEEECSVEVKNSGCRVIMLPSLGEMSRGNQQLKNEAWKILQTVPA